MNINDLIFMLLGISHMLFADDSYLFCKASENEALGMVDLLQIYEEASGQRVNADKSSIFFSTNVSQGTRSSICRILQMNEADGNSKYLGLPSLVGRNKSSVLGFLKDRVRNRVNSWKEKWVSQAGREVLIKNVAQTLPSYAMSVFLLPLEITKDFERSLTRYWWNGGSNSGSGIHWMAWDRMNKHKATGGLGFRNFHDFNLALLGKQGWRFISRPQSLVSRVYKARYFPDVHFLEANLGNNPSFIWRSIWEAKNVVKAGVRWKLGSGVSVRVRDQPWLQDECNPYITSELQGLEHITVSSLMKTGERQWEEEIVMDWFNFRDQQCILNTSIGGDDEEDLLYWGQESSGEYSVKSAYRMIQAQRGLWQISNNNSVWRDLWRIKAPPKVLNLVWRALSNVLPTKTNLYAKFVPVTTMCPICDGGDETIMHALVECPFADSCWRRRDREYQGVDADSFAVWLERRWERVNQEDRAEIASLCWSIWNARNKVVWENKKSSVDGVLVSMRQYLAGWNSAQNFSTQALYQFVEYGDGVQSWVRPKNGAVKITVDAATFAENYSYGIGMLARDDKGEVICGKSDLFQGSVRPEFAEAIAVKEALSWSQLNKWKEVVLESDCLAVVQAVRSSVNMVSPFGQVIKECREMLKILNIAVFHIKRSANEAAHFLARESSSFPGRVFDGSSVPVNLVPILLKDLRY